MPSKWMPSEGCVDVAQGGGESVGRGGDGEYASAGGDESVAVEGGSGVEDLHALGDAVEAGDCVALAGGCGVSGAGGDDTGGCTGFEPRREGADVAQ